MEFGTDITDERIIFPKEIFNMKAGEAKHTKNRRMETLQNLRSGKLTNILESLGYLHTKFTKPSKFESQKMPIFRSQR